jgi:hypothetical protein
MREIEYTDFINVPLNIVMGDECLKVNLDGVMQFYVLIRPQGGMIARVSGIASLIDSSRGMRGIQPPETSQEELDANLVEGRVADPDPTEVEAAKLRVQARVAATEAKVGKKEVATISG